MSAFKAWIAAWRAAWPRWAAVLAEPARPSEAVEEMVSEDPVI